MATALVEDGKEYIRSTQQIALRWCSIEVIKEGKYSALSDVWAFGILAYEVFACGTLPYADQFDNLTEISSFVKEGGKIGRPNVEACPLNVYEQLMLPCFAADPADRPAYGDLYQVAVHHGAEEDEIALTERKARRHSARQRRSLSAETDDEAFEAFDSKGSTYKSVKNVSRGSRKQQPMPLARRQLLGPSVYHIKNSLVPAVLRAIVRIKEEGVGHEHQAAFNSLQDPGKASIDLAHCPRSRQSSVGGEVVPAGRQDWLRLRRHPHQSRRCWTS